ncbi:MAG: OmpH family outer membrane protein [Proteobacteria bacterium]|nr:OmpH family outer membrane protein [Pseudomonadota bacterium]
MKRFVFVVVAGAMLVVATGAAALAAAPASEVGVVDIEQIYASYPRLQELNQRFAEFRQQQEAQLQQMFQTRLLTDEEQREFTDLLEMGAPTEAREARLTELAQLSAQRDQRLGELGENESRTAEEEQEYTELEQTHNRRVAELTNLQLTLEQAVSDKHDELWGLVTEGVEAAVQAVAEEQSLTLVLQKEAVLYGGVDITDAVVARLSALAAE